MEIQGVNDHYMTLMLFLIDASCLWLITKLYFLSKKRRQATVDLKSEIERSIQQFNPHNSHSVMESIIEGREKEREVAVLEIHDGIFGNMAAIKLSLSKKMEDYNGNHTLHNLVYKIDHLYQHLRRVLKHLKPANLEFGHYYTHLKEVVDDFSQMFKMEIALICYPREKLDDLSLGMKKDFLRITQELLWNIFKHAASKEAEVQFIIDEDRISLMVEDYGKGFDAQKEYDGQGLTYIHSRLKKYRGTLVIDSVIDRGTIMNINVPLI
ncbi:MAG: hypothetical protein KI790_13650 [Cyclobacteriaceae bacterium]|nr:hypothetical protein [Cyclobacteriaceae bacterium HetDA_MAG_MS6]